MKKYDRLYTGFISGTFMCVVSNILNALGVHLFAQLIMSIITGLIALMVAEKISLPNYKGTKIQGHIVNLTDCEIESENKDGNFNIKMKIHSDNEEIINAVKDLFDGTDTLIN